MNQEYIRELLDNSESIRSAAVTRWFGILDAPSGPHEWIKLLSPHGMWAGHLCELPYGFGDGLMPRQGLPSHAGEDSIPYDFASHAERIRQLYIRCGLTKSRPWTKRAVPFVRETASGFFVAHVRLLQWIDGRAVVGKYEYLCHKESAAAAYWSARRRIDIRVVQFKRYYSAAMKLGFRFGAGEHKYTLCNDGVPLTQEERSAVFLEYLREYTPIFIDYSKCNIVAENSASDAQAAEASD